MNATKAAMVALAASALLGSAQAGDGDQDKPVSKEEIKEAVHAVVAREQAAREQAAKPPAKSPKTEFERPPEIKELSDPQRPRN